MCWNALGFIVGMSIGLNAIVVVKLIKYIENDKRK